MAKAKYRVKNWSSYNESLKNRGSISFLVSKDVIKNWNKVDTQSSRGRKKTYSDFAIELCLMAREFFKLALRQTEGLIQSFFKSLGINAQAPNYSTISRRANSLLSKLRATLTSFMRSGKRVTCILLDSTGLKIYGEGEWKVRQHGVSKRRGWRKLHIAVCAQGQTIEAVELTDNNVHDSQVVESLIKGLPKSTKAACGDGAYDTKSCRNALNKRNIEDIIPPQRNAKPQKNIFHRSLLNRDNAIFYMHQNGESYEEGRKKWKEKKGYHRRSLVETAMYRIKKIFGPDLKSRKFENQTVEALIRCKILNMMTSFGMPQAIKITQE